MEGQHWVYWKGRARCHLHNNADYVIFTENITNGKAIKDEVEGPEMEPCGTLVVTGDGLEAKD